MDTCLLLREIKEDLDISKITVFLTQKLLIGSLSGQFWNNPESFTKVIIGDNEGRQNRSKIKATLTVFYILIMDEKVLVLCEK